MTFRTNMYNYLKNMNCKGTFLFLLLNLLGIKPEILSFHCTYFLACPYLFAHCSVCCKTHTIRCVIEFSISFYSCFYKL